MTQPEREILARALEQAANAAYQGKPGWADEILSVTDRVRLAILHERRGDA